MPESMILENENHGSSSSLVENQPAIAMLLLRNPGPREMPHFKIVLDRNKNHRASTMLSYIF